VPIPDSPLAEAARQFLTAEDAAAWIDLLRPAFHLRERAAGEPVVGYLGGSPLLPADIEWPTWERHGPLAFIGAIDCSELPTKELDIPLPEDGALLFFYFDGQIDDSDVVEDEDWTTPATTPTNSRVLYVPADAEMAERVAPEPLGEYDRILLSGDVTATGPDFDHPAFRAVFGDPYDPASPHQALSGDEFGAAVDEVYHAAAPNHQIAGYARPVQSSIENEAARSAYPVKSEAALSARAELAGQLVVLAQIDSEYRNEMAWGDAGTLYWVIRPEDLAARNFDAALFTWQSH
jgi:uncharacterized protein YwqG